MLNKERFYQSLLGRCSIFVYSILVIIFDTFAIGFGCNKISNSFTKRLLLIRMDAIGDFILWLPAAKAIRELYPPDTWQITLVGNQNWSILAEQSGFFDHIYPVDSPRFHRDLAYRFRVLHWISRQDFEIAINSAFSRELLSGDALLRASKAQQRIGHEGNCANLMPWLKTLTDCWYTKLIPNIKSSISELRRNADFVASLGGSNSYRLPDLCLQTNVPPSLADEPFFVLFPGGSWHGKQWPAVHFAEIARLLSDRTGWLAVICGGSSDLQVAKQVQELGPTNMVNFVGRTSLDELATIIAHAKLLLSNDTSAAHIGAAVSTSTVCVLGGGHFGRFLPYDPELNPINMTVVNHAMPCYGCNWQCIHERESSDAVACVAAITVDEVWRAVLGVIANSITCVKAR